MFNYIKAEELPEYITGSICNIGFLTSPTIFGIEQISKQVTPLSLLLGGMVCLQLF